MKLLIIIIMFVSMNSIGQKAMKNLFTSEAGDYSVSYPKIWYFVENPNTDFIFIAPSENGKLFNENINLIKTSFQGVSEKDYTQKTLYQLNQLLVEFYIIKQNEVIINNIEYKKITYTHSVNGMKIKVCYYLTFYKDYAYGFTCSSLAENFSKDLLIFETIIESLKYN